MKLCILYNYAQHYRTNIFTLIDKVFNCDFVFGDSMSDVKKMDYSLLKHPVTETHTRRIFGGWYYQPGFVRKLFQGYTHYILLGETRAISTWLFLIMSKFFPRKRVYLWSHGWYGKETTSERIVKKFFFRLPNGGVFLYGNYARDLMINEGFSASKLFVIHNSLAYDQQISIRKNLKKSSVYTDYFKNENFNLIFVGRLTSVKKLDMILESIAINREKGKIYNLTLIGTGEKKESLEKLTEKLGLQDNVWFYGPCYDEKKLSELIYNADLCVSPGNVGLTAMHSLVFGTPVITHDDFSHQMPEFESIKEKETGIFFKYDNLESLASKINEWFDSVRDRECVRKKCMKEVDDFWTPYYQIEILKKGLKILK